MQPFLVPTVGRVLSVLRYVSFLPAYWLRRRFTKEAWAALIEAWVIANFILALLCVFALPVDVPWLGVAVTVFASIRLVEIIVSQFNTQLYGGYPGKTAPRLHYDVISYRRSIFMAGLLYLETSLWFAALYRAHACAFTSHGLPLTVPLKAFYYSIVTI